MSGAGHVDKVRAKREEHLKQVQAKEGRQERHSSSGVDGSPKKGGGGGRGTWGSVTDEIDEALRERK